MSKNINKNLDSLRELAGIKIIKEDANLPKFVLIHHADSESAYDCASAILQKFGMKDIGSAKDFGCDDSEYDTDNVVVFAATKPQKSEVQDACKRGDIIWLD